MIVTVVVDVVVVVVYVILCMNMLCLLCGLLQGEHPSRVQESPESPTALARDIRSDAGRGGSNTKKSSGKPQRLQRFAHTVEGASSVTEGASSFTLASSLFAGGDVLAASTGEIQPTALVSCPWS